MSTNVVVETTIVRPRSEVASYAMDWRNDRDWIGALTDVQLVTDGEFGVGSQVKRVASFLGRRIEYVNEVVELIPNARLSMRSVRAPFPMTVVYEFEDAGESRTLFRIRAGGDARGFYRVAGPMLQRAVSRRIEGDLRRVRQLLETESPS